MCKKIESSVMIKIRGEKMVGFGISVLTSIMTIILGKFGFEYISQGHTPALDAYFLLLCFAVLVAVYTINKGYAKIEQAIVLEKEKSSEEKKK